VAELRRALATAVRIGSWRLEVWAYLTLTDALEGLVDHERAILAGRDGLARARQLGLSRQIAAPIAGNLTESLASVGRWDEALEIADEILGLGLPPLGRQHALLIVGRIALARGDQVAASRALRELHCLPVGLQAEAQRSFPVTQLDIDSALAEGDVAGALAAAATVPVRHLGVHLRYSWPLLAAAMRACADAVGLAREEGRVTRLREDLKVRAAGLARPGPVLHAYAVTVDAEASRAEASRAEGLRDEGGQALARWDAAAAAWEAAGHPHPLAYTLLRAASAAAVSGNREAAVIRLSRAATIATQLAAVPLQQHISRLARRARIQLAGPGHRDLGEPAEPFGLTAREQEVLRLVAAGRSNREIAAGLFISPRTASVHVSNILGKLHVASRGEAAATAHRLQLFDPPAATPAPGER